MEDDDFRATLYRVRHYLGVIAGAAGAWILASYGFHAFDPFHLVECGFLCIFLFIAMFWWIVAVVITANVWFAIVMLLNRWRPPLNSQMSNSIPQENIEQKTNR
jgi:MFS superfamily sulfate permease-like transporter